MLKECRVFFTSYKQYFREHAFIEYIFVIRRTSILNCRLSEVPEREKEKISCYAYMRAAEKNENTSHCGLTHAEILKGGSRNIRKTFERTNDANLFSFPLSLLFFSYSPSCKGANHSRRQLLQHLDTIPRKSTVSTKSQSYIDVTPLRYRHENRTGNIYI